MLKSSGKEAKFFLFLAALLLSVFLKAQDNSPYSRYGLGDMSSNSNIITRGMGGISAGYADGISINFNNPASYSQFLAKIETRSKKVESGRVVLDVGLNFDNRTLIQPNTTNRFTSSDALFSYLQLGLPIKRNWGFTFGLRPVSRISYLINRSELLQGPNGPIDSVLTQFRGSGGAYLPTIGTGYGFTLSTRRHGNVTSTNSLSLGANFGYMFGSRETTTLRSPFNDTVSSLYYTSDHTVKTSFGDIFANAGLQYEIASIDDKGKSTIIRFGLSGNLKQNMKASQDALVQTVTRGSAGEILQIDSVFQQNDKAGTIVYPASYKAGFTVQHMKENNNGGWLFGADYSQNKWEDYRFFGQRDSVQNTWMISAGAQLFPKPRSNFFSRVVYRVGFGVGKDYVKVDNDLPLMNVSFGMGIPIGNYSRISQSQYSVINLAFEYGKRGNNDNRLKENLFRVSVGLNFTDLWFGKKKYE